MLLWLVILLTIVCLRSDRRSYSCIVVVSYIVDHCCLMSDRRSYLYCCGWLYC